MTIDVNDLGARCRPYDENLLRFCSNDNQATIYRTYGANSSNVNKTAKVLDKDTSTISKTIRALQVKAGRAGYSPTLDAEYMVPSSEMVKGRSVLTKDGEGNMIWLKTEKNQQAKEDLRKVLTDLASGIKPIKAIPKPKTKTKSDLLTLLTLTDYHLGMYAWDEETGDNWDMEIAEGVWKNAIDEMIEKSPDSEQGILCQLGDLAHWDGLLPVTPTAKNVLDGDSRFHLLARTATRICIYAVEAMLAKFPKVHVIMAEGNHDIASSVWLTIIMQQVFGKNKRVSVETSPFPYYSFLWGRTFLGFHHGHLMKMDKLAAQFSQDPKFRRDFGQSDYVYVHTGHLHTEKVIRNDIGGTLVEQHPTLASRDAHGARGFLWSNRGAKSITYDKSDGEISRIQVRPTF